jgi:hypothetical protein
MQCVNFWTLNLVRGSLWPPTQALFCRQCATTNKPYRVRVLVFHSAMFRRNIVLGADTCSELHTGIDIALPAGTSSSRKTWRAAPSANDLHWQDQHWLTRHPRIVCIGAISRRSRGLRLRGGGRGGGNPRVTKISAGENLLGGGRGSWTTNQNLNCLNS